MITKLLGFERAASIEIPREIIESCDDILKLEYNKNALSPVWETVFKAFPVSQGINSKTTSADIIKDLYENFFKNGLSDGACAGLGMEKARIAYRYWKRTRHRYRALDNLKKNMGVEQGALKTSLLLNTGCPWLINDRGKKYNPEILDHEYFCRQILNFDEFNDATFVFIGDGSGILSNLIINNMRIKEAIFIDLPHFLIRQKIVNSDVQIPKTFWTPHAAIKKQIKGRVVIINQDSFPEITAYWLNKYFNLPSSDSSLEIFSYNKIDQSLGHTDYHEIISQYNLERRYMYESPMRANYHFEYFSYKKNIQNLKVID